MAFNCCEQRKGTLTVQILRRPKNKSFCSACLRRLWSLCGLKKRTNTEYQRRSPCQTDSSSFSHDHCFTEVFSPEHRLPERIVRHFWCARSLGATFFVVRLNFVRCQGHAQRSVSLGSCCLLSMSG